VENMRTYATKHALSWYKYVNGSRGRGLANGELYLITGYEKAWSWGMASYSSNHEEFVLAFKPTVRAVTDQYRWSGAPGQKNPSQRKSDNRRRVDDAPLNHTTFIHGLSISLGTGLWSRLIGTVTAEISSIADFQSRLSRAGGSHVAGSQGSSFLWPSIFLGAGGATGGNPAKLINEYILHKVFVGTICSTRSLKMTYSGPGCDCRYNT
jgi:hypothetical protein